MSALGTTPIGAPVAIDLATGLPRLALARFPTPLEEAPRLAAAIGLSRLWIKREDLAGYALGGNKLRKLDFLLADAMERGADTLVATAGAQSNFCRALAGAAAKVGLGCHLHLRAAESPNLQGNLLLDRLFGARITTTDANDPWDPRIRSELDQIAERYRQEGRRPQVIQLTGESAPLGVAAWISGAAELARDFDREGSAPDAVALACGSGLTLAGLALGFKHLRVPARVLGFSVQQPAERLRDWIVEAANRTAGRINLGTRLKLDDFILIDDQIGSGYGVPTQSGIEAVALAGCTEALVLDPVYTGKALAGVVAAVLSGRLESGRSLVFLHSGGTPNLFAHAGSVAEHLA